MLNFVDSVYGNRKICIFKFWHSNCSTINDYYYYTQTHTTQHNTHIDGTMNFKLITAFNHFARQKYKYKFFFFSLIRSREKKEANLMNNNSNININNSKNNHTISPFAWNFGNIYRISNRRTFTRNNIKIIWAIFK